MKTKRITAAVLGTVFAALIHTSSAQAACGNDSECAYNEVCESGKCVPDGKASKVDKSIKGMRNELEKIVDILEDQRTYLSLICLRLTKDNEQPPCPLLPSSGSD